MRKVFITLSMAILLIIVGCKPEKIKKDSQSLTLEEMGDLKDSFSYAVGFNYGLQLKQRLIYSINYDPMVAGMHEALSKDSAYAMSAELYNDILAQYLKESNEELSVLNIKESKELVETISKDSEIQRTENGLYWRVLREGDGPSPSISDTVMFHFVLEFPDGKVFEDTEANYDKPARLRVADGWPGMVEGLQLMRKGAVYQFFVPYEIGFGKEPKVRGIPPNKAMIITISLLDVE